MNTKRIDDSNWNFILCETKKTIEIGIYVSIYVTYECSTRL